MGKLRTDLLPMLTLTWISDRTLVAAGHNCVPVTFNLDTSGSLTFGARLEEDRNQESSGASTAMRMFKNQDRIGTSELQIHDGNKDNVNTISSVAGDGKLIIW